MKYLLQNNTYIKGKFIRGMEYASEDITWTWEIWEQSFEDKLI